MLSADWVADDIAAYSDFCDKVDIADISVPLQVWANESDNKAAAHNPHGDASGIFQLTPGTAAGLGYDVVGDPHLAKFRALGVSGQLTWASKFYSNHASRIGTVARFYLCTFLPSLVECGEEPEHVLAGKDGPLAWAYAANWPSFDPHKTGTITVQSLVDAAEKATGPRTHELVDRVRTYRSERTTGS